jgi:cell division protein FtsQ
MASVDPVPQLNLTRSLFNTGLVLFWSLLVLALSLFVLDWVLRPDTWPVRSVSYQGPFHHVTRQQLEQRTMSELSGNFLTADLPRVQRSVESLPWVAQAWVSRRWPDGVQVRFTEQKFVARWGKSAWVNGSGQVVALPNQDGPKNVVRLNGPAGSAERVLDEFRTLAPMLASSGLTVDHLELTDRRTWQLQLHDGISLVFGHEPPKPAVQRFLDAYPYLSRYMARIQRIDLRYENGFAVGWKDGKAVPIHLADRSER